MRTLQAIRLALCLCLAPSSLRAAPYDGSVPLLCAAMTVLAWEHTGACQRRTAARVGLPAFITIDFAKQLLHGTEQQGRTSALKHLAHLNARLILHGGEEGRGWTVVIAEDTGTMAATVAEDQVGFVVFGACIPR